MRSSYKKKYKRRTVLYTSKDLFIKWARDHVDWIPQRNPLVYTKQNPFWMKKTYRKTKEYLRSGKQWEDIKKYYF